MRRMFLGCIVAILTVLMTGLLGYTMDMSGKIGFGGYGGYSLFNPTGINDILDEVKQEYESWLWFGPDSGTVRPLTGGIRYWGEIRYGLTSNLMVGAGYSRMSGSGQINWEDIWGSDWFGTSKATLSVTGFTGSLILTMGKGNSNLYLGGGVGLYWPTITLTSSDNNDWIVWGDWENEVVYQNTSTVGFHGIAGFEKFLSDNIAFAVEGMYSSVTFPGGWTITEHPDSSLIGEQSTIWTNPVQSGGITIAAGFHFYVG